MKKTLLRSARTAAALAAVCAVSCATDQSVQPPFEPTMESLEANYRTPEWFKDAKFGIFAHWGPQCQAESGDWYARNMYTPGDWQGRIHRQKYGDPKVFGFKDVIHEWKAENWDPQELAGLFKSMGAKYVVSLANHHDNFDLWDSKHQEWNSVRLGPGRDLAKEWKKAVQGAGLHWGASVHASHAWCWYETSRPYDGLLKKEDGAGTWWGEMGLDPQELYAQDHEASPDNRHWDWDPKRVVPPSQEYRDKFMKRHKQLIDDYEPEILYYDDTVVPFWPTFNDGVELTAYYYNTMFRKNHGKQEVVVCGKVLNEDQRRAMVWDVERGVPGSMVSPYWQTDTCIGSWHYDRGLYDRNGYKSADTVIRMLVDIVAKGGNLLLSVPIRGDGTVDEKERAVCAAIGDWMKINGEGIYGTRTWKKFGSGPQAEGPGERLNAQGFNEGRGKPATAEDIRYTTKDGALYVFTLDVPSPGAKTVVNDLDAPVKKVTLLGYGGDVKWSSDDSSLVIETPRTGLRIALCYKVEFAQ